MTSTSARDASAVRQAVRDTAPVALAYAPFGLALGATLAATRAAPLVAWSSSPLLFGGAAQLVAVRLLDTGASAVVVVLAALVVNARMLLYSAALAPHTADWPVRRRWAAAYLLADPVYALAMARFEQAGAGSARERFRYFVASGVVLWTAWMALTGAGVLLAGVLPDSLHLELAAPLTFLLLLLPMLTSRATYSAAATGGIVACLSSGLPLGLDLLIGAGAGIAAGAIVGARRG